MGIGDAGHHAGNLHLGAGCGFPGLGNGHLGIFAGVNGKLGVLEFQDVGLLDFQGATEILHIALDNQGVVLVGLVRHVGVAQGAVGVLGIVNADGAGSVGDFHGAIGGVGHGGNSGPDDEIFLGNLILLQLHRQQFRHGLFLQLRLGGVSGVGRLRRLGGVGGLRGVSGVGGSCGLRGSGCAGGRGGRAGCIRRLRTVVNSRRAGGKAAQHGSHQQKQGNSLEHENNLISLFCHILAF